MKFKNSAERMQHSQARLIPDHVWDNYLSLWNLWESSSCPAKEFPDELIPLVQLIKDTPNFLLNYLRENQAALRTLDNKIAFIIVLSYPDLDENLFLEIKDLLTVSDNDFFRLCAEVGNLRLMKILSRLNGEAWTKEIIDENFSKIFRGAATNGYLPILHYLAEQDLNQLQALIAQYCPSNPYAPNDYSFHRAARNGHLDVLIYLGEQAPNKLKAMILENDYAAFNGATSGGHLPVLHYFAEQVPHKLQGMIKANDYDAFRRAANNGHLPILYYFAEQLADNVQAMIAARNYYAFRWAASDGHLPVMEYLAKQAPHHLQAMIAACNYHAFCCAASGGHLSILHYLAAQAPDKLQDMIAVDGYYPFCWAASNGHLPILHYLAEQAPDRLQAMIEAEDYHAFRWAASNDHLPILRYLAEQAPDKIDDMVAAENYKAFQRAAHLHNDEMVVFLLPHAFAYAESHVHEYANYTNPFIAERLHVLRRVKAEYGDNPIQVTPEEAKQLFYLARALIRRGSSQEDLRLILEVPAVRELAHQAVTPGYPNELLRLAARVGNREASNYLQTIPAVEREAEANNFYMDEYQGRINLRLLAQDRESSMTALSQDESERLDSLKNYYLLKDEISRSEIIEELRSLLITRYEEAPAVINITNLEGEVKNLALPCSWEEFNKLSLSDKEKENALIAYYKDKNHTAWRFLEKPNPWMHPNAFFTNRNNLGAWSSFEAYEDLIAVLFLAAKDENISGIDGYTVEDRVTHFIGELALIGRAHNWDTPSWKKQEHDDLTGDKPSCYSGIKRRLFQSVQGHPLLKQLTSDLLQQEVREFVWSHFQAVITEDNSQSLSVIWQKSIDIDTLTQEEQALLSKTNISKEDQTLWLEKLNLKYGKQINRYETSLFRTFDITEQGSHFIRFAYLGLDQLLKNSMKENAVVTSNLAAIAPPAETDIRSRFFYQGNTKENNNYISNAYQI